MPIFEYQCKKCEHCFERLTFARDKEPVICPECGADQVIKMMSCVSFMGKGIGAACGSNASSGFS